MVYACKGTKNFAFVQIICREIRFFVKKFANVDYFLYLCSKFIVRALACVARYWKRVSDIMGLSSVWKAIQP